MSTGDEVCYPRTPDGTIAMCAKIMSREAAKKYARFGGIPPRDPSVNHWGALCGPCWDDIGRFAGDCRAVAGEWRDD